jgi:hypothetical protein
MDAREIGWTGYDTIDAAVDALIAEREVTP